MMGEGQLSAPESRGSQPSADVETTGGVPASVASGRSGCFGSTLFSRLSRVSNARLSNLRKFRPGVSRPSGRNKPHRGQSEHAEYS